MDRLRRFKKDPLTNQTVMNGGLVYEDGRFRKSGSHYLSIGSVTPRSSTSSIRSTGVSTAKSRSIRLSTSKVKLGETPRSKHSQTGSLKAGLGLLEKKPSLTKPLHRTNSGSSVGSKYKSSRIAHPAAHKNKFEPLFRDQKSILFEKRASSVNRSRNISTLPPTRELSTELSAANRPKARGENLSSAKTSGTTGRNLSTLLPFSTRSKPAGDRTHTTYTAERNTRLLQFAGGKNLVY